MLPVFRFPILCLFPLLCCTCCYVFPHVIPEVLYWQSVSVAQRQVERVWNLPLGRSGRGQVEWHLPDESWKGLDVCLAQGCTDSCKTEMLCTKSWSRTGGIRSPGYKCCCSLCFGNSNTSLGFSRDFQILVWFQHLWHLPTFSPFLVAFLLILCGALCLRTTIFSCTATSVISDRLMSSQGLERDSAARKTVLSWSFGQRVSWLRSTYQVLNKIN